MTVEEMIASLKAANAADYEKRAKATDKLSSLRALEHAGTEIDAAKVEKYRSRKADIDAAMKLRTERIEQLEKDARADKAAAKMAKETRATGATLPPYDGVARVGAEERSYHKGNDPRGKQFLQDVGASFLGDFHARERMARHDKEERIERKGAWQERATSTGSFVGLTVPQYLTDFFAPNAKAMRPSIEAARQMDLPSQGMVVNVSRITGPSLVQPQIQQNNAVANQDMSDTLLTIPIQSFAGQQTMSRQAIERSTGAEEITLDDLMRTYYTAQDNAFINQAIDGLTNRATVNTFTAAPGAGTVGALYANILAARSGLETVLLDVQEGDQLTIMHSRRWAAINSVSSNQFPFMSQMPNSRYLTGGEDLVNNYGPGYRGNFAGLNVIVDNNVPINLGAGSNQDEIYVVNRRECIWWEDPSAPVMIRAEQTNAASLGVLFVLYGYCAFTFDRYQTPAGTSAQQKVSGTGLTTPLFSGGFVN